MKYEKSFYIIEKFKPDAKYRLQCGIVRSNVSDKEIPIESEQAKELIELGWVLNETWCRSF
jgi:hypothetical protein